MAAVLRRTRSALLRAAPLAVLLLAGLAAPIATAQRMVVPLPPVETFTEADRPTRYWDGTYTWEEPWGYRRPENAGRAYPLVVFGPWDESGYFTTTLRQTYPAFYLVFNKATETDGAALSDQIDTVIASQGFRIALNRIYLTGFSAGGSGSYKTIRGFLSKGKCFAGLIRLAGQSESVLAEGAVNKIAISMHIGLKDDSTRIAVSRALYAYIRDYPANARAVETVLDEPAFGRTTKVLTLDGVDVIRYSEYPNMGHTTGLPYSDPALYSWIMTRAIGTPTDQTPPSTPTNLHGHPDSATSVNLTWTAATDNVGVTGYRVFRDGTQIGTATATAYTDTGLTTGTAYSYRVVAIDAANNASGFSASASVVTHDEAYTAFAAWVAGSFTVAEQANTAISGPNSDPDGCGLTNLERYAFGVPARGPIASPVVLTVTGTGGNQRLALTFPRKGYAPDLQYTVQSSTDLVTWADLQSVPPGYPKIFAFTDSAAISSATRRFLRLRVAQVVPIDDAPQR
jgi:hypothetical protein